MKRSLLLLLLVVFAAPAFAQVPTDGLMMPTGALCTGFIYQRDSWKEYWEGSLKRENLNIGEFTGQTVMWYGVYGLSPKINIMGMLPYISNKVSMGTLMSGVQDLTIAAKYKLIAAEAGPGKFYIFPGIAFSAPMSNYSPDFLPISLGVHTKNASGRLTFNYTMNNGVYLNATGGYTWRSNTKLDRPAYYTDGHYYSTDIVDMPNQLDYKVDLGYHKGPIQVEVSYMQMNTLGGGDIRRQDMPFASNRMNANRIGALVMYYVPFIPNLGVRGAVNYTVAGRNVGQTTSLLAGLMYTIKFKQEPQSN
jgi:hypothetical protein